MTKIQITYMMVSPKQCTNKTNRVLLQQLTNHTIRDYVTFTYNYD